MPNKEILNIITSCKLRLTLFLTKSLSDQKIDHLRITQHIILKNKTYKITKIKVIANLDEASPHESMLRDLRLNIFSIYGIKAFRVPN